MPVPQSQPTPGQTYLQSLLLWWLVGPLEGTFKGRISDLHHFWWNTECPHSSVFTFIPFLFFRKENTGCVLTKLESLTASRPSSFSNTSTECNITFSYRPSSGRPPLATPPSKPVLCPAVVMHFTSTCAVNPILYYFCCCLNSQLSF